MLLLYTLIVIIALLTAIIIDNKQSITKKINELLWDKNKINKINKQTQIENFHGRDSNRFEMIKILQSSLVDPDSVNPI